MSKITEKVELTANILIIVVAVLLGGFIAQRYFSNTPATANSKARVQPTIGSKMNLTDVNWSNQPKTLILALNKGCHFCTESAPFYKRLIENTQNKNVKLVAVFPGDTEESKAHLNALGLTNMEVKRSPLNNLQVSGTPTLILTNEKGEITDYWVGKLTPDKETEVLNKLNS